MSEQTKKMLIVEMMMELEFYMREDLEEFEPFVKRVKNEFGIEYLSEAVKEHKRMRDQLKEYFEEDAINNNFPCIIHEMEENTHPDRADNDAYYCRVCGLHFDEDREVLR